MKRISIDFVIKCPFPYHATLCDIYLRNYHNIRKKRKKHVVSKSVKQLDKGSICPSLLYS